MTKLIHCSACNAAHSLKPDSSLTRCDCGKVEGWWHDAANGLAVMHTPNLADRPLAHCLSLHNGVLNDGPALIPTEFYDPVTQQQMPYPDSQHDTFWRQLHEQAALAPRAPEAVRIFDQSRRACWAVIIVPGTTSDVAWATLNEAEAKRV